MKRFDEFVNEGVKDYMTPISDEKISDLRKKGKVYGRVIVNGYTSEQALDIIRKYSDILNRSFVDDTHNRIVDWMYMWRVESNSSDEDFSDIELSLSSYGGKYTIDFVDNRKYSWKNFKNMLSVTSHIGSDYQFCEEFELLEDALIWLENCGIDTSKITRK